MKKPISAWVMRRMGPMVPVAILAAAKVGPAVTEVPRFFSG